MMRTRCSLLLMVGLSVGSCSSQGHAPTAPELAVPEPPLGGMVAKVNGVAWTTAYPAKAGLVRFGPPIWSIDGQGDGLSIQLVLPGAALPKLGSYTLGDINAGGPNACLYVFVTGVGWNQYCTTTPSAGLVSVTRADSVSLAGTFQFTVMENSTPVHVTSGAFNVTVDTLLTPLRLEGTSCPAPGQSRLPFLR
jgi:hypothetical protein